MWLSVQSTYEPSNDNNKIKCYINFLFGAAQETYRSLRSTYYHICRKKRRAWLLSRMRVLEKRCDSEKNTLWPKIDKPLKLSSPPSSAPIDLTKLYTSTKVHIFPPWELVGSRSTSLAPKNFSGPHSPHRPQWRSPRTSSTEPTIPQRPQGPWWPLRNSNAFRAWD